MGIAVRQSWRSWWRSAVLAAVLAAGCGVARAAEYHGNVTFGGQPVPGATVTATQGDKKLTTVTGVDGSYSFADLADGTWTIEVQMSLFAPVKQDVQVAAGGAAGAFELKLLTLDQMRTQDKPVELAVAAPAADTVGAAGAAAAKVSAARSTPKPAAAAGGAGAPPPPPVDDSQQQKAADGFLINGSVNNAATSPFSQNQRFGNGVNNGRRLYTGLVSLVFDNSALNAIPYSLTGTASPKPDQSSTTGSITIGGPIRIPHIIRNGPNFTVQYSWMRSTRATMQDALVPDALQRTGDFSQTVDAAGNPVVVYDPATQQPYTGNVPVSQQAQYLLQYYPLPNVTSNSRYNYEAPVVTSTHQDAVQFRANRNVGPRDNFFGTFAMQSTRSSLPQGIFPFADKNNALGLSATGNWTHRFGSMFFLRNLFMNVGYQYSRLRNQTRINFQDRTNVSDAAGITGNNQDPMNWGPPALNFLLSGTQGLGDGQSAYNRNQTNMVSLNLQWNHGRHFIEGGGEFRRQEFNYLQQSNARGTFGFTGAATRGPGGTGGWDFADFLIGVPDTSTIATGNADKYLRQSVYTAFINDDWRLRPELTVKIGLRWDYGAPITETKDRLVNLDITPGFTAAMPVLATSPKGPLTNADYPRSLMRPDRLDGIQPRVSLAWLPIPGSSLVVRAGYGVYVDTSVYQQIAVLMAQQSPLSKTLSVQNSRACPLTLANGFVNCSTSTPNTFAVDPGFRVGYAQTWQLSVQRDLPFALQMTASYLGVKGTRGVQEFLPNTYAVGGTNPCPSCPVGFAYLTSNGNSTHHEGSMQLRRRLRSGFTATATYKFSKSLDNDSMLGGQGPIAAGATGQSSAAMTIAQNWRDLRAERGLSTFDQRHLLTLQAQYTTGMGLRGGTLMGGWRGAVYREWTVVTDITVGSGTPETPVYVGTLPGTSCSNCMRPNATGADPKAAPPGFFVNPAAFASPAPGTFGNARKGSIIGPGQFAMNASMARTFPLRDRMSLDAQLSATNVLNHVTFGRWNTTVGSTLFGLPATPNQMRTVQGTLRLRF